MFVFIAPGQGSQTPGMLAPWLRDPEHAARVRDWSQAADVDLAHLGTRASAAEIARTENTQPLLVAHALLAHTALGGAGAGHPVAAGHSVGELAAAAVAGALDPADAIRLAAVRGRAMAAACAEASTGLTAVIGGEKDQVLDRLAELGLSAATFNGPGQIVAGGPVCDLRRLATAPPPGATVKALPVAGAFHTAHMESARRTVADAFAATAFRTPHGALISNADGALVTCADEIRDRLVGQVTRPVRWDLCLETLGGLAPALVVSLPPTRTLTALLRRRLPDLTVLPANTPRDLATLRNRLDSVPPAPVRPLPVHPVPVRMEERARASA
ncbi:ACP S-malonyltransferase [Streptomyces sp. NPDC058657]|uniref:ACP S-malonyltransferase n=1 Tax=unclassified Streptomyces TaxID=2593676 RepID=UPI00364662DF